MTGSIPAIGASYSTIPVPWWLIFIIFLATTAIALILFKDIHDLINISKVYNQVLDIISKFHPIFNSNELYTMPNDKDLVKKYSTEANTEFRKLLSNPVIVDNEKLFKLLQKAENRTKTILYMADIVCFDSDKLDKVININGPDIISFKEYKDQIGLIVEHFVEAKKDIFKYCKRRTWITKRKN